MARMRIPRRGALFKVAQSWSGDVPAGTIVKVVAIDHDADGFFVAPYDAKKRRMSYLFDPETKSVSVDGTFIYRSSFRHRSLVPYLK